MQNKRSIYQQFFLSSFGSCLHHYDKALFTFLAPFLSRIFFKDLPPITALMLTYGLLPISFIAKPLAALFFGYISDKYGSKQVLKITVLGMAFVTLFISGVPKIWIQNYGPLILGTARLAHNFFASGETTGGILVLFEKTAHKKRGLVNALYDGWGTSGIFCASLLITYLIKYEWLDAMWRTLYLIGGMCGLSLFLFRQKWKISFEKKRWSDPRSKKALFLFSCSFFTEIKKKRWSLLTILFSSALSYGNYYLLTTLLSGFLPIIGNITPYEAMKINTLFLALDLCLLPLGGILSLYIPHQTLFYLFGGGITLLIVPLYALIDPSLANGLSILSMTIRLILIALGIGFSVVLFPVYQMLIDKKHAFSLIGFSRALGAQLLGASSPAIGLWLYQKTGWIGSIGLYLSTIGIATIFCFYHAKRFADHQPSSLLKE